VRDVFKAPSALVSLVEAEPRLYRTRIREGTALGANFAGHYSAVSIGCGSNCGMMFVVDLKTTNRHERVIEAEGLRGCPEVVLLPVFVSLEAKSMASGAQASAPPSKRWPHQSASRCGTAREAWPCNVVMIADLNDR